jgi:MFS family permease
LLVSAILASATRSGLAGSAIACAALWILGRRLGPGPRRAAIGVLVVIVTFWTAAPLLSGSVGSLLGARLSWWHDEDWLRAECEVGPVPAVLRVDQSFLVPVLLQNTGSVGWNRAGARSVLLSYHWKRLDGRTTLGDFEGIRTQLLTNVAPGDSSKVLPRVQAPAEAGTYLLRWDLVEENITWFRDRGHALPEEEVIIEPALEESTTASSLDLRSAPEAYPDSPPRSALWRAALVLWRQRPLLGIGPDNFRRRYEAVLSPSPTGQPYTDTRIHANSLYFETLADLGLAGLAALGAIGVALVNLIRAHVLANRLAGVACGVAAALFFVHGVFDYFLEFTPLFCLFWLLLGLTAACEAPAALRSSQESAPPR